MAQSDALSLDETQRGRRLSLASDRSIPSLDGRDCATTRGSARRASAFSMLTSAPMSPDRRRERNPWQDNGARSAVRATHPGRFIDQHILPLLYRLTKGTPPPESQDITSEEQFWGDEGIVAVGNIRLRGFRLTDWFPRAPGVYWSRWAGKAREQAWSEQSHSDPELGRSFSPKSKMDLIEEGGIGTIRLRPRRIDGIDCWLATALTGPECHRGVPLAIPDSVLRQARVDWGDPVDIRGRVRFLQDAGLHDTAARVQGVRPLIVFVEELKGATSRRGPGPIIISPVALFESVDSGSRYPEERAQYTFVQCAAGADSELDAAIDWIGKYVRKYDGRVITNFDEQRPVLAEAPLSYQRLVDKTYDRTIIERFHGTIRADRIDAVIQESSVTQYSGDVHMGHKIHVGGSAIINIDSVLTSVTQTIGDSSGLDAGQKSQLQSMVETLKAELEKLKNTQADEAKAIADALEKAVSTAARPAPERKQSLLTLSANGLRDAAELVKDTAPSILATATLIAKFIVDLGAK